ncbi:MAG: peptidoglycan DD-metalloendopeptidase family protein [Bacteroidetes bacterium]|nr:peptidoglycan DD-metalloendopeptidase family protein [Bacteroidota bacterium]
MSVWRRHIGLCVLIGALLMGGGAVPSLHAQKKKKAKSSTSTSVQSKQKELDNLRAQIQKYEDRIKESEKRERSALQRLDDYDRQTSLIRSLVTRLTQDIAENQKEIAIAQLNLATAENELRKLKREFARIVVGMYKRGRTHDTELLLSAESVNEMFIRSKYLKAYSEKQRLQAQEIRKRKKEIEIQKLILEEKLRLQQQTIQEKRSEEGMLRQKVTAQRGLIDKVRQDKESYETQLRRKQAAARKIERIVADLIERERKKLESARRTEAKKSGKAEPAPLPSVPISNTKFGKLRGRLPWPVAQGAVVESFGEHVNPRFGTVSLNLGIDIAVPAGSQVRTVADGEVTGVHFVPGFGNLLFISHDDGFITVYAHLSEVLVRVDKKVTAGQVVARSGESVSGPRLHFELWFGRSKQDPLGWLAKR